MTHFSLCLFYWYVLKCVSKLGKTINLNSCTTETLLTDQFPPRYLIKPLIILLFYTPYVAMELTNLIGCSRTLRSMNSCYFFEDIDNKTKIFYHFPPQAFFCKEEKNAVDFVRLHQMMSNSGKLRHRFSRGWSIF